MLALIHVPHEYSRNPFYEKPKQTDLAKLLLSIGIGLLGCVIAIKILLSLEALCMPSKSIGKADQNSCLASRIL